MLSGTNLIYEPGHSISYKITCAPNEDSDQPAHPRSLIRVFAGHSVVATDPKHLQMDSEDSDQPSRVRRLIRVFAERTCNLVGNVVVRLK